MPTLTVTQARNTLYQLVDSVADTHVPVLITGKRTNAVLISEEDWRAVLTHCHFAAMQSHFALTHSHFTPLQNHFALLHCHSGSAAESFRADALSFGSVTLPFGSDAEPFRAGALSLRGVAESFRADTLPFGSVAEPFRTDALSFGSDALPFGSDSDRDNFEQADAVCGQRHRERRLTRCGSLGGAGVNSSAACAGMMTARERSCHWGWGTSGWWNASG